MLGESIPRTLVTQADVRSSLQASIRELPLASQRLLATYGFDVDKEVLEKATVDEQDAALAEKVDLLLPHEHYRSSDESRAESAAVEVTRLPCKLSRPCRYHNAAGEVVAHPQSLSRVKAQGLF